MSAGRLKLAARADGRGRPTVVEMPDSDTLLVAYDALAAAVRDVPVALPPPWHLADLFRCRGNMREVPQNTFALSRSEVFREWRRTMKLRGKLLKVCG